MRRARGRRRGAVDARDRLRDRRARARARRRRRRHVVPAPRGRAARRQGRAGDRASSPPATSSTRVPAHREDEIGDLARGFNSMADSLQRGQAELERSNAELKRSNAELEQFASVTSHDLQAPLTTISMYAELLERRHGPEPDGGHDLIDGIRGATTQARTLIRDLLEYSRAGRGELDVEPLPLRARRRPGARGAGRRDRVHGRAGAGRLAARRARRPLEPLPGLPEPHRQRREVHARRRPGGPHRRRARRRAVALRGPRQRDRHGPREHAAHLRAVPPPARRGGPTRARASAWPSASASSSSTAGGSGSSSEPGEGSVFSFTMPAAATARGAVESEPRSAGDGAHVMRRIAMRARAARRARAGVVRRRRRRPPTTTPADVAVRIGTKNFTESEILGELYKQALEAKGVRVELQSAVGPTRSSTRRCATACWTCTPSTSACCCRRSTRSRTARPTPTAAYALAKQIEERRELHAARRRRG